MGERLAQGGAFPMEASRAIFQVLVSGEESRSRPRRSCSRTKDISGLGQAEKADLARLATAQQAIVAKNGLAKNLMHGKFEAVR